MSLIAPVTAVAVATSGLVVNAMDIEALALVAEDFLIPRAIFDHSW